MLVCFGQSPQYGPVLMICVLEKDIPKLQEGQGLDYINPPHDAQLVRNVIVFSAKDKPAALAIFKAAGMHVTEQAEKDILTKERTDRGFRAN